LVTFPLTSPLPERVSSDPMIKPSTATSGCPGVR
jgi:hypothetical protein